MAFCQQCGQQLPEGANACPNCGTFVNGQAPVQQAPAQQAPVQQAPVQQQVPQNYQQPQQGYQQAPQGYQAPVQQPVTPEADVQQNRGIAWLSYMGLLFLIPMFAKKDSEYCQFHVKQGATLFAVELAYAIVTRILLAIINAIFPGDWFLYFYSYSTVYNVFNVIFSAGYIFLTVLAIIGIVNAATGKKNELLLLGKIPWIAMLLDKFYKKA